MKIKKIIIICVTIVFFVGIFAWQMFTTFKVPTNENKETLKECCDQIAETLDAEMIQENFTAKLYVDEKKIVVYVEDDTNYGIEAKYNVIQTVITGDNKSVKVDLKKAIYSEMISEKYTYSTEGKRSFIASEVIGYIFKALFTTVIVGSFCALIWNIIALAMNIFRNYED